MRRIIYLITLVSFLIIYTTFAQESSKEVLERNYPQLMERYGDMLPDKHAHYIFVMDVSSSMRQYEDVVKSNLKTFIDAIPDGDQISLIKMSNENHTDFVGNGQFKCIELNSQSRIALKNVIESNDFSFMGNGNPNDGSDGYTMTKKVIEAINMPASNELTFVYMFTDFEYWTRRYLYNKDMEDWHVLKNSIHKSRNMQTCKYGLELQHGGNLRQNAIFKGELDDIFNGVEYQSVSSAHILSQWFEHMITNVMANKLNSIVKEEWRSICDSMNFNVEAKNGNIFVSVSEWESALVDAFIATAESGTNFKPEANAAELGKGSTRKSIGTINSTPENFFPSFKKLEDFPIDIDLRLLSKYEDEIQRLKKVCKENDDVIYFNSHKHGNISNVEVWNSYIPLWCWVIIIVAILIILVSIVYEIFFIKVNKEWQLQVKRTDDNGNTSTETNEIISTPSTLQSSVEKRPVNYWKIRLYGKKYNPLFFWKKSGYYITLEEGAFIDIMDPFMPKHSLLTLQVGNEHMVCKHNRLETVIITVKSKGHSYKITIV